MKKQKNSKQITDVDIHIQNSQQRLGLVTQEKAIEQPILPPLEVRET